MRWTVAAAFLLAAVLIVPAPAAQAQVASLFYKEVAKDGRIYVFNTPERFRSWEATGDMGTAITLVGVGPNGETVVGENETALDLFFFKHDLPGYERPPAPKPPAPKPPTSLRIGDEGELKFGALLQAWYVADDSPDGPTSTGYFGNYPGNNTFLLRRAEIKLSGKVTRSWAFEVMIDPAKRQQFTTNGFQTQDEKILQDLLVAYVGLEGHEFGIGQGKIALTDEGLRSSSQLLFAERARVTRTFSDRRETGVFYEGEFGHAFALHASLTNGTRSNVPDSSNDTVLGAVKFDVKPSEQLVVGASGGYSGGETPAHLSNSFYGAHLLYNGPERLPLTFHAEYMLNSAGRVGASDLDRDGYYAALLYTFAKKFRFGVRYEEFDNDKDTDGNSVKTFTAGFHYMIKGRNINLKFDWNRVTEEGRVIGGQPEEDFNVGIVAAQVAF